MFVKKVVGIASAAGSAAALMSYSRYLGAEVPSAALVAFLAVQLMVSGFLIYRLTGARWAASALALFSMSYAFMATIIASMMLSEA